MKRKLFAVAVTAAALMLAGILAYGSASASDYQVIKRAAAADEGRTSSAKGEVTTLRIEVRDTRTGKVEVKVSLPLSLVEIFAACEDEHEWRHGDCHIDLTKVLRELKKAGPQALVEVSEDDESVRIWLE